MDFLKNGSYDTENDNTDSENKNKNNLDEREEEEKIENGKFSSVLSEGEEILEMKRKKDRKIVVDRKKRNEMM